MHRPADVMIGPEATIREAMVAIDNGAIKIALVVGPDGRLVATVSDGDVRRAILAGASLDDPIAGVGNQRPRTLPDGATRADAVRMMREHTLDHVPVIGHDGGVAGLFLLKDMVVPLAEPSLIGGNILSYLQECIDSNFVSSVGPFVDRFEREFAAMVGTKYAVACISGTAALHVALLLCGAGPGRLVAAPSFTFIASANAVAYTGADLLLFDSEPETWNGDAQLLHDDVVRRAKAGSRLPDIIEAVHLLGHPADLEPLIALRERFGIPIVEDAAEALGASYTSGPFSARLAGSIGDIGCFSFNGNKIITTGGGGMIVTDDVKIAERARHLTTQAKLPGPGYVHDEVGFNYRLSNLAAAVGVAQLEELPQFVGFKQALAARYDVGLAGVSVTLPPRAAWASPTYWLYSVLVASDGPAADVCIDRLNASAVQARPLWHPLHLQAPYAATERIGGTIAEDIARRGISLPSSVGLTPNDQEWVIDQVRDAVGAPR
jgi:perosamine synthetase